MGEKRAERGRRGWLSRVSASLRWIWIIVFSASLLASIVFHAPWKVAAVCSILLLGAIAIPRRSRRYFWAAIGLILLAGTTWVFLPNDSQGWRPYTFDNEMEAFLAKHRVPDAENAARVYEDIRRKRAEEDPNEPNVPDDWYDRAKNGPWRAEEHPAVAAWLDYHEPTLKWLGEAADLEQCFFEESIRDWSLPLQDSRMLPIAEMRQWAFMLAAAANRDWGERGLNASMAKQLAVLKLGMHLSSQPETLFSLTGAAVEILAMEQFNRAMVLGDVDSIYLASAEREVASLQTDGRSVFGALVDHERLRTKNLVSAGFYQVNDAGRVRYSRDPFGLSRHPLHATRVGSWEKRAGRAGGIMGWFVLPSDPAKVSEAVDDAYEKHASLFDPKSEATNQLGSSVSLFLKADWSRFQWNFEYFVDVMAAMGQESLAGLQTVLRKAETTRRGTLVIVALRRYKDEHRIWPRDLEAAKAYAKDAPLMDAWDRPFVYKSADDGFVLYSIGANGIDEKGRSESEYDEENLTTRVLADDVMIWPVRREGE